MDFEEPVQGHLHWTEEEHTHGKQEALRTILILSAVTVIEVGIAMAYDHFVTSGSGKWAINLFMAVASVVKVYYIMGTFMHLKHEKKWFILSALLPFSFLVWAIIAFTWEGTSWHAMRAGFLGIF